MTKLPDYRNNGTPFQVWLFRIACNLVVDNPHKLSVQHELPYDGVGDHDPARIVQDQTLIEQLQTALQVLKPFKQDVIILRLILG